MDFLLEIIAEPLVDLIIAVLAAVLGSIIFGTGVPGSSQQGKIQTIFDGDPQSVPLNSPRSLLGCAGISATTAAGYAIPHPARLRLQ
jgi:hypothetical protein